jgi:hypothetical protein
MLQKTRQRNMDVSNSVDVTNPAEVADAVVDILSAHYPAEKLEVIKLLTADFDRLYRGEYPGFHGCDVGYHNSQHVLDVTLAMARLIDGYENDQLPGEALGVELAVAGIACALFHDAGYIRRLRDTRHANGAEYTRTHVTRSARFLTEYLPGRDLAYAVPICQCIVHFTGYELNPSDINVPDIAVRSLGWLLGTADLIAQIADVAYVEKCRDKLYPEFVAGGMAGDRGAYSETGIIYKSPSHLVQSTPNFIRSAIQVRLDGYFHSYYRFAESHFGGSNLYMDAIQENCTRLEMILARKNPELLRGDALSPPR